MNIREHFPILKTKVNGKDLVYLDNAATSQKPESVISTETKYYEGFNANVHRAPHDLSAKATSAYEGVREKVRRFINAESTDEIVFTKGTTDSVNLVASSLKQFFLSKNSKILLTEMEHHSNIVPWQLLENQIGLKVIAAKVTPNCEIDLDDFESKLTEEVSVVSLASVSNAIGTVHPLHKIIPLIRKKAPKALIFIDGAQSVAHVKTDVRALDVDFFAFSSHKAYGPTGVGILYGKKELLLKMPPVNGGGDMIEKVSFSGTTYALPPFRFEAGTPNIAGVIALGAAIDFINSYSWENIAQHEEELSEKIISELSKIKNVRVIGNPQKRMSAVSFIVDGMSPLDVAVKLNDFGVAVRAGHHCCMPLMDALGIKGTTRASWGLYTTTKDIDLFISALNHIASDSVQIKQQQSEIEFGMQHGDSPRESLEEIKEELALAAEARSELLIEFGAAHPRRLNKLREITPEVPGCMSEVRLLTKISEDKRLFISSDSNSEIVRGLLAIIERVFSGQLISEIKKLGVNSIHKELELSSFVSIQRRSGLDSVLNTISKSINQL